ncbi:MAG: hypothetical protein WCH39_23125 [Schlesneria sp.]
MSRNTVSIAFDRDSLQVLKRSFGLRPVAIGAYCDESDDDGEADESSVSDRFFGAIALGAHCSPKPPPTPPQNPEPCPEPPHTPPDDDGGNDEDWDS